MKFVFILLIIFSYSCIKNSKEVNYNHYKKIINFYYKSSNYKKCVINQEMDKIFKEKKLIPIFRIENYYCYSIWLVEDKQGNILIYYSIFDNLKNIYETSRKFLIKNKTFNKVKSVNSDFFAFQTIKQSNGKSYIKNILKHGNLSIYNKKVSKNKYNKFNKLISKIDKTLYDCKTWADVKESNYYHISEINIASYQLKLSNLRLDYPFIKNKILKNSRVPYYENKGCIDLKFLIDYIFELTKGDK